MPRKRARKAPIAPAATDPPEPHTAPAVVPDPYSLIGETILATRSIRGDRLAGMFSRGDIDLAQFTAGRRWQECYERAGIGSIAAMDPLKEPVDGRGAMRADFTDMQLDAFRHLDRARIEIGIPGHRLLDEVLGHEVSPADAGARRGWRRQDCVFMLRLHLEKLAKLWGYAA